MFQFMLVTNGGLNIETFYEERINVRSKSKRHCFRYDVKTRLKF